MLGGRRRPPPGSYGVEAANAKGGEIVIWASGAYEQMKSARLPDSGADAHVMTIDEWERCGKPRLTESDFALKTASGEDLGTIGKVKVRGWATGGCSAASSWDKAGTQLRWRAKGGYLEKDDMRLHLSRDGKRDVGDVTI